MLYKLLLPSFLYIFGWTEFAFLLWYKPRLLETETLFDAPVFKQKYSDHTHTHTHTRLTALFPGLPRWASTRKVKPVWILLKQETVSGSGISWAICKSASCCRQITMPVSHHSSFLQAGCPSCRPTNSVKALKAQNIQTTFLIIIFVSFYHTFAINQ